MNQSQLTVELSDQQSRPIDDVMLVRAATEILQDHEIQAGELSIAIVDDPTIRRLNQQYLNHDYETDVISFVLERDDAAGSLDGQLIVSTDTATRVAIEAKWPMQTELLLYVIHGTLHLVGYDDKDPESVLEMRRLETEYLERFGHTHRWVEDPGLDPESGGQVS